MIQTHQPKYQKIIEKKENPKESDQENQEKEEELAEDCAEEEKDEEGNCPTGPKKIPKITPDEEIFTTTYYEFQEILQQILKDQKVSPIICRGVNAIRRAGYGKC